MTMAATMRSGGILRAAKGGNRYAPGRSAQGGGRRIRPGKALVWLFGLGMGAAFVALVSLALLVGFRWLTTSSYFSLREISVAGNQRLEADEVIALAGVELGENTLEIKIADVEERVAANPWTERAAVRRELPAGLTIAVDERTPHWWVRTGRGLFYAEADGAVIDHVGADKLHPLPLLDVDARAEGVPGDLPGMTLAFDTAGLPVHTAQAAWLRVLPGRMEFFFEERGLTVAAATEDWERNMRLLSTVWNDLVRRGEDTAVREVRIFGGKVWVTT